jgi:hypothetical protein
MSILSSFFSALNLDQLFEFVLNKFPKLRLLLDLGQKIVTHFTGTFDAAVKLFNSFQSEVLEWKNFREDFRLKSRVVNIERAIEKTKELVQGLFDSWRAILDLIKNISTKVELGGAAEIVEAASGIGLPVALVNAIVLIVEVLDTVRNVIDDIQTVIDEITRIRLAIEKADTIFLQQNNPRKIVKLANGKSIKIRVGGLHKA